MASPDVGYEINYGELGFIIIALAAIGTFFVMGIDATRGPEEEDDFLK